MLMMDTSLPAQITRILYCEQQSLDFGNVLEFKLFKEILFLTKTKKRVVQPATQNSLDEEQSKNRISTTR